MSASLEKEDLMKLAAGGKMRQRRLRNVLIAHLLREGGEAGEEEDEGEDEYGEEGGGGERKLARLLIGSRILRRGRVRRMLLAHLLSEKRDEAGEEEDEGEDEYGEEGSGDERKLARLLIASRILRRQRVRHMLLAHLVREGGEAGEEEDEGEDEYGEEAGGGERKLARLQMGKRGMRRSRARRMLVAHLMRERREEAA